MLLSDTALQDYCLLVYCAVLDKDLCLCACSQSLFCQIQVNRTEFAKERMITKHQLFIEFGLAGLQKLFLGSFIDIVAFQVIIQ